MKILYALILTLLLTLPRANAAELKTAEFALGCFWCAEHDFEALEGVHEVLSGYEGGAAQTATYEQVSSGTTGHFETVQVHYDPEIISYDNLLKRFWDNVDPFDTQGQFCDKGRQYNAVIFVKNEAEKVAATASLKAVADRYPDKPIAVQILPAKPFYKAEAHHQNYAEENTARYKLYRAGCGRDKRLNELKN